MASSASFVASNEPSASPSGFSWVTSRKRSFERSASATACRSLLLCVWGDLFDELGHAGPPPDGRIVFEGQLGSPLHSQLPGEARLQNAVGSGQPGERLPALRLGPEHAHEDARVPQVWRRLDSGDGDEADPRVLQLAERLRDHLADGLVDATHALAHSRYSSDLPQPSSP